MESISYDIFAQGYYHTSFILSQTEYIYPTILNPTSWKFDSDDEISTVFEIKNLTDTSKIMIVLSL